MKKVFAILAVALVALSFASCKGKKDPVKEAFKIDVTDVTSTGATITITPADTVNYYYWTLVSTEYIVEYGAETLAELLMEEEITEYESTFESLLEEGYIVRGKDVYTYTSLDPEMELSVIAFHVDKDLNVSSEVGTKDFKTSKFELKGRETLNITAAEFVDYTAYGVLQILGLDEAKEVEFALTFDATELDGTFTEADLWAEYSGVYVGDDIFSIVTASVTTQSVSGGARLKANGKFAASNGVEYSFSMEAEPSAEDYAPARKAPAKRLNVRRAVRR